jgi:hypothetical protein
VLELGLLLAKGIGLRGVGRKIRFALLFGRFGNLFLKKIGSFYKVFQIVFLDNRKNGENVQNDPIDSLLQDNLQNRGNQNQTQTNNSNIDNIGIVN